MSNQISPANRAALLAVRRGRYPHMGPLDSAVWRLVLEHGLFPSDRYEYDVRLGGSKSLLVDDSHELKPMWETLLRKRVDVVAWSGQSPTLVEVKPVASFAALGQCLGYRFLWRAERGGEGPVRMACACAVVDEDLRGLFESLEIRLVCLPVALAEQVFSAGRS